MGYTNKLQSDRVTGVPFSGMAHTDTDGERAGVTESPFYPSERVITAFNASRFRRIWTTLLGRCAGPPQ